MLYQILHKIFPFLLDILFIYISNVIPFGGVPSENPVSSYTCLPCFSYESAPPPAYPFPPYLSSISLHWSIKPSQCQRPLLPLMPDKALSAPSVLPLTFPLGSLCSVLWLTVSIYICTGQDLAEPLERQASRPGSSCICSRGWPSRSSMGGEVLGPVKALCPILGKSQG